MLGFRQWFGRLDEVRRKRAMMPNHSIDSFEDEVEALQKVVQAFKAKKASKKVSPPKQQPAPKKKERASLDDSLTNMGKVVWANLKTSPEYYARLRHIDDLTDGDGPSKKVSRQDAKKIADNLGFDFQSTKFTPETFRKGLEYEVYRKDRPTMFARAQKSKLSETP